MSEGKGRTAITNAVVSTEVYDEILKWGADRRREFLEPMLRESCADLGEVVEISDPLQFSGPCGCVDGSGPLTMPTDSEEHYHCRATAVVVPY